MAVPEGYTKLGLVGYSFKGSYSDTATYNRYNCVNYSGSTYVALADNLTGVTPEAGSNWAMLANGASIANITKSLTIATSDWEQVGTDPVTTGTTVITLPYHYVAKVACSEITATTAKGSFRISFDKIDTSLLAIAKAYIKQSGYIYTADVEEVGYITFKAIQIPTVDIDVVVSLEV